MSAFDNYEQNLIYESIKDYVNDGLQAGRSIDDLIGETMDAVSWALRSIDFNPKHHD